MPKSAKPKFWWFRGASVEQLRSQLAGAGECRLEVHLDGTKMTLHVIPEGIGPSEGGGATNESHVCPPSCP